MQLTVKGKNIELPETIRSYVDKKFQKLSRHLPFITEVEVEITIEDTKSVGDRAVAQVTINSNGTLLRGEQRAPDPYVAIDAVADVMDKQIKRYKERLYRKGDRDSVTGKEELAPLPEETEEEEEEEWGKVVRVKRFAIRPMDMDEALEQMELLGHAFYFFYNAESGQFNVIYRRNDGDYGLIVPVL